MLPLSNPPIVTLQKIITNIKGDKQSDDGESKSSKSSKSTKTIKSASITKLQKYHIKIQKSFTTLNSRIE